MRTVNFDFPEVSKMTKIFGMLKVSKQNDQFKNLYISSHGVAFGAPPQEVLKSLPHNHMTLTNLFISSYRGATVIKFGKKKQLFDRSP